MDGSQLTGRIITHPGPVARAMGSSLSVPMNNRRMDADEVVGLLVDFRDSHQSELDKEVSRLESRLLDLFSQQKRNAGGACDNACRNLIKEKFDRALKDNPNTAAIEGKDALIANYKVRIAELESRNQSLQTEKDTLSNDQMKLSKSNEEMDRSLEESKMEVADFMDATLALNKRIDGDHEQYVNKVEAMEKECAKLKLENETTLSANAFLEDTIKEHANLEEQHKLVVEVMRNEMIGINKLQLEREATFNERLKSEKAAALAMFNKLKLEHEATLSAKSELMGEVSHPRRAVGTQDEQDPLIEGMMRDFNLAYPYVDVKKICKRAKLNVKRVYDLIDKGCCAPYVFGTCKVGQSCRRTHRRGTLSESSATGLVELLQSTVCQMVTEKRSRSKQGIAELP